MGNCSNIEGKIFASHICQKCGIYWQKTCCWCQWNFKFGTQTNYIKLRKKPQNNFFHWGQHHCESGIWNIQIFFVIFFIVQNIWCFFEASVQLVPTILFTSCLQTAWTAIDFYRTQVSLVRSLCPDVRPSGCPSDTLLRLNWCDSGWWGYQLNTNW